MSGRFSVKECPIRSVYAAHGKQREWKDFARLLATYYLKASGTVEHILELKSARCGQARWLLHFVAAGGNTTLTSSRP